MYDQTTREATPASAAGKFLAEKIRNHGTLSFAQFMESALYHPEYGYYATPNRLIGRAGDFYTSVSAGPVFGLLLALHIAETAPRQGPLRILELGAHDGRLALDILSALSSFAPTVAARTRYAIIEPLPSLAQRQRETLHAWPQGSVEIVARADSLKPMPGILIANELIDALPCHVLECDGESWHEIGVKLAEDASPEQPEFCWSRLRPAGEWARHLPLRAPGYRTEIRPELAEFLRPLARLVTRMLWIDYGFERDEYLHPGRTCGTLQSYHQHRALANPLAQPGERDITAHVDFTALREAIEELGGQVVRFETQSRFLTSTARPWLLSLEGQSGADIAKRVRNFHTLTHPAQLGTKFHVMEACFQANPLISASSARQ